MPGAAERMPQTETTMRMLAAADLHGAHDTYAWLVELARQRAADVLVLAGDLLGGSPDLPVEEAQAEDARLILELLDPCPCPVLFVMGNDDLLELPSRSDRTVSIHGRRWSLGPHNFVGYQYSLPFMAGVFEKPDHEIEADLDALAPLVDEHTILVTHSPAFGILDRGILNRRAGSHAILDFVRTRRPRAHIHGHIHQCVGRQGRHWNVGTYQARRAVLIDLDALEDEVIMTGQHSVDRRSRRRVRRGGAPSHPTQAAN